MPGQALVETRHFSPARAIVRACVASTACVLLVVSVLVLARRLDGALVQPLPAGTLPVIGITLVGLASGLRVAWPRPQQGSRPLVGWSRLLLPSAALTALSYALSVPGSSPWSVGFLWLLVVGSEASWWWHGVLAGPNSRQSPSSLRRPPESRLAKNTAVPANRAQTEPNTAASQPAFHDEADPLRGSSAPGDTAGKLPVDEGLAATLTQQMTRLRNPDGSDLIFGEARAEFAVGERSRSLHLAFCPPLVRQPDVSVMQADGPAAAINVVQAEPYGARVDLRLAAATQEPAHVMVEFEVRTPPLDQP